MSFHSRPAAQNEITARLGARFQAARNRFGVKLTLTDLAKALGVSMNTLRWHEAGARMLRADQIHKAAEIMDIAPGELLTLDKNDAERGARFSEYRIRSGIKVEVLCKEIRALPQELRWHEMGVWMLERDQLRRAAIVMKAPLADLVEPDGDGGHA